jgi:ABC-type uncharacterized transport system YnjBCD permease subunit
VVVVGVKLDAGACLGVFVCLYFYKDLAFHPTLKRIQQKIPRLRLFAHESVPLCLLALFKSSFCCVHLFHYIGLTLLSRRREREQKVGVVAIGTIFNGGGGGT